MGAAFPVPWLGRRRRSGREVVTLFAQELFHRLVGLRDRGHLAEKIRANLLAESALINERLLSLHLSLELLVLPRENDADESQAKTGEPDDEEENELPALHFFEE